MTPLKRNFIALISVALTTVVGLQDTAMADGIIEQGSWTLWEDPNEAGGMTCYMQAIDKSPFRKEDFLLEIHKVKNSVDSPIEVIAKINKNKRSNTAINLPLDGVGSQLNFSDLNGNKELFWAVPKNLSALVAQLQSGQDVSAKAVGGTKELDISWGADGFNEVFEVMMKHCHNGFGMVEDRFEKQFLASMPNSIDPTKLSAEKTVALRKAYFDAFKLHRQNLSAEADLAKVLKKYQAFIDEQKTNRSEKNQITTVSLPQSQKTLADSQKAQIDHRAEIARLAELIPSLEANARSSQAALDASRAILAPLLPEFNRLNSVIRSAQGTLQEAQNRLSVIDSRISDIDRRDSDLRRELDTLDRNLRDRRFQLDRAISELRDAEFSRSRFDVRSEIDRRLRQNGEYSRIKSERQSIDPQINQTRQMISELQGERNRVAEEVERCRAVAGQDCSSQIAALQQIEGLINSKQSELRNLESRRSELDRAIDNVERQVDRDVRREYDQLVDRENQARRNVSDLEEQIRRDQSRVSSIRDSELPRLSDERRSLVNERPSIVSRITNAESQLNLAQRDLSRFKSANDFDRKAADVAGKEDKLESDQAALSQAVTRKADQERRLQAAIKTESDMKARIAELNSRVVALDLRNVELDKLLKNLPAERAPVDARIADLKKKSNAKRDEMLALLKA